MIVDGWWDVYSHQHMGQCAELGAREKDITRADPDAFAAESHRRALVAQLPELRPAFDQNGTVTAGNASSINEAFSVVSLVSQRRLDPDPGRVNVHGGAVAIAHPIGGSGTRILVTSLYAMITRGCRAGGASLCSGGDDAITLLVERDAS